MSDRIYLEVGEELIISFHKKEKPIEINAFAFAYIKDDVLKKALPFLTYITISGYRVTVHGNIIEPDDTAIIQQAYEYGVAPIMLLSTLTEQGIGGFGLPNKILNDMDLQDELLSYGLL